MKRLFHINDFDQASKARTGVLELPHGPVATPVFMPVGTAGTVKAISHDTLHEIGFRLILANTYHLFLRPGQAVLKSFRGLHQFTSWNHNFLTDSGGYQVFSLSKMRHIREEGAEFQSHIDGSRHMLTPEGVAEFQAMLGSDVQMPLDVCTAAGVTYSEAREAMEKTHRWASRAVQHLKTIRGTYSGALFPIIQGNFYQDLRKESVVRTLDLLAADGTRPTGIAIGGLSVGESFEQYQETLAYTCDFIPADIPRYVMGIGTPEYILAAIEHGVDMFDCVFPTRAGRNGTLFTRRGRLNLRNAQWAHRDDPPDPGFDSFGGRVYSLGYLRHLVKTNEILASMLATEHNLRFLWWLTLSARRAIKQDRFGDFKKEFLREYSGVTPD